MKDKININVVLDRKSLTYFVAFGIFLTALIVSGFIIFLNNDSEVPAKEIAPAKYVTLENNQKVDPPFAFEVQKTFYLKDTTNVRKCASSVCEVLFTLPLNHEIKSPYKSTDLMPEWLDVEFEDGVTGYINRTTLSENKTIVIRETIRAKEPEIKSRSLPEIIKEWRPRTAYLECYWNSTDTGASGSGLILGEPADINIITNRHVFTDENDNYADECLVKIINDPKVYQVEMSEITTMVGKGGLDWAMITIFEPSEYLKNFIKDFPSLCKGKADIGDQVAILGYPSYGSGYDEITATEGIISGYDSPYYTTSAKIEHGNSGGLAVLTEKNCYVGIPTAALVGEIESLGRILDIDQMFDVI